MLSRQIRGFSSSRDLLVWNKHVSSKEWDGFVLAHGTDSTSGIHLTKCLYVPLLSLPEFISVVTQVVHKEEGRVAFLSQTSLVHAHLATSRCH